MASLAAIAAASSHYRSGRYGLASNALLLFSSSSASSSSHPPVSGEDNDVGRRAGTKRRRRAFSSGDDGDGDGVDDEAFAALPALAAAADLALCRARSASLSNDNHYHGGNDNDDGTTTHAAGSGMRGGPLHLYQILRQALDTNKSYRRALVGAATSLRLGLRHRDLGRGRRPNKTFNGKRRRRRQRRRRRSSSSSIASAVLMAAVSASWIHLRLGDTLSAERALRDSVRTAVECLVIGGDTLVEEEKEEDGDGSNHDSVEAAVAAARAMTAREALHFVSSRFGQSDDVRDGCGGDGDETDERGSHAVRLFRNALRVVGLALDDPTKMEWALDVAAEPAAPKTNRVEGKEDKAGAGRGNKDGGGDEAGAAKLAINGGIDDDDDDDDDDDTLCVLELLTRTLIHHRSLSARSYADDNGDDYRTVEERKEKRRRKMVEARRDECLWEAISLEGGGGPAFRLRVHLDGLKAIHGLPRFAVGSNLAEKEASSETADRMSATAEKKKTDALRSLTRLAPTCRTALDLMGCIHIRRGDFLKALDAFQSALERGGGRGNDDEEEDRATVSKMARCFAAMGEAEPAVELLLHLLAPPPSTSMGQCKNAQPPTSLVLTSDGATLCRRNAAADDPATKQAARIDFLWRLFATSSLAEDWATCMAAVGELWNRSFFGAANNVEGRKHHPGDLHAACARAFALLQGHRPSLVLEMCCAVRVGLDFDVRPSSLPEVLLGLYEADATILTEKGFDDFLKNDGASGSTSRGIETVDSLTKNSLENYALFLASHHRKSRNDLEKDLGVAVRNNRGIALLLAGNVTGAMACFKEAGVAALSSKDGNGGVGNKKQLRTPRLFQPFFNLTLLLWREGFREEALNVWFHARGLDCIDSDARARDLRRALDKAINRHGFCVAGMIKNDSMVRDHIGLWTPPKETCIDNQSVDEIQVSTLDVILLKYAATTAAKTEALSFRKQSGFLF